MKWRECETLLSQRWSTVFTRFKENDIPHTNLVRLVSVVMCLPRSNAAVERVFSQMNDIWTDSRNRFTVPSIQAILIVKTKINLPCEKFMEMLAKDRAIQNKIHSSEKYASHVRRGEDEMLIIMSCHCGTSVTLSPESIFPPTQKQNVS